MESIVAISDSHLGYRHRFKLKRLKDYEKAFNEALAKALDIKPAVIVFCGDLLHHTRPDPKSMRILLQNLIKAAESAQVVVCIGNHEIAGHLGTAYSPMFSDLHRNIHVLTSENPHITLTVDGKQIGFHGFQYLRSRESAEGMLERISTQVSGNDYNILCLHQAVEKYLNPHEISLRVLREVAPKYNLILLGHVHKHQKVGEVFDITPTYYVGSTERISFNEWQNQNGFMVFREYKFGEPDFVSVSSASIKRITADLGETTPSEINNFIDRSINDSKGVDLLQINISSKMAGDFFDVRQDWSDSYTDFTVLDVNIQPSGADRRVDFQKLQINEELIREYFKQTGMEGQNELLETCMELYSEI
ncbi:MAG: DNA repair exonuclease [Candidatus Altiarchaeota archaeon]